VAFGEDSDLTVLPDGDDCAAPVAILLDSPHSPAVLRRVHGCEFSVGLYSRFHQLSDQSKSYLATQWVGQETRAAIATGKPILPMVDNGVRDIGGLRGDREPHIFDRNNLTRSAIAAVNDLKLLRQLHRDGME